MSGTYTIDSSKVSSSTNFKTFTDVKDSLNKNGVKGPVVINVADGVYKGNFTIDPVKGQSSKNNITFQSASNDSSKAVVLEDSVNVVVSFTGYYIISKLTFQLSPSISRSYFATHTMYVLAIGENATISHCQVIGLKNNSAANVWLVVGSHGNNMTVDGNLLKYGPFIFAYPDGVSGYDSNNVITNNIIDSIYDNSILINIGYEIGLNFSNNIETNFLANLNLSNSSYSNNFFDCFNSKITKNKFLSGLDFSMDPSHPQTSNLIANNFISASGGISIGNINNEKAQCITNVMFNNVSIHGKSDSNSVCLNVWKPAEYNMISNNLANFTGGYALQVDSIYDSINYNNYYSNGNNLVSYKNANLSFKTLSAWQTFSGKDSNSISANPIYINDSTNLHATNDSLSGKGIAILGITTDIDGNTRPNPPTIGANEIKVLTGIETIQNSNNNISIYPNPATSSLSISSTNPIQSISIFDATGREVYQSTNLKTQNQTIPVNNLPSGIYMIKLGMDNGSYIAKFMKE